MRNFSFRPEYIFATSPTEFLENILWDFVHDQMRPRQCLTWLWATPSCWCDQR